MTRMVMIGVLAAGLAGCAHTKVVAWNGDQIKVCGGKMAQEKDFNATAAQRCPAGYQAIGGGEEGTGHATATTNAWTGTTSVREKKQQCMVYRCQQ